MIATDAIHTFPVAIMQCNVGNQKCKTEFLLPIGPNKFSKPAKIPKETLETYYEQYTNSGNPNYWQLDSYIKNPAFGNQTDVKVSEVVKKAGVLHQKCFNFECLPIMNPDNTMRMINATGSIIFKKPGDK